MQPPIAERHLTNVYFGKESKKFKGNSPYLMNPPLVKKDYYNWLRDDERKNKNVLKYLDDENNYADSLMMKIGINVEKNKFLSQLRKNMVEDYETIELPEGCNGFDSQYRFYKLFEKGKSYPIYYYRKNSKKAKYLDPNDFKKDSFNDISEPVFSPSLNMVAYGIDTNGTEKYSLNLFEFPSMEKIEHKVPKILYSSFLLTDNAVFYLEADEANVPFKLCYYNIDSRKTDIIFELKDKERQLQFDIGEDYKSVIYWLENYDENETYIYWFDGERKGQNILVKKMKKGVEYNVLIFGDYFFIRTNANSCDNFVIKYCKIGGNRWYNLIEYDENIFIENINDVKDGIVLECRSDGEQFFRYLKMDGIKIIEDKKIKKWKGGYYLCFIYSNFNSNRIVYSFQNFITPPTYYELDLSTYDEIEIFMKKTKNFDPSKYEVERIFVKNINNIPVDIIKPKNNKTDKCLLYGYNSYGSNVEVKFDEKIFPLIDSGIAYAVANVRGSCYLGNKYYKDGMMLKKINTFKDFIKVSEHLIKKRYCLKDGLSIEGRSAGGLLVGAVSTMRPDLYKNVIAGVPFVDVLATMSDSTIPLTTGEWTQWGNPNIRKYYNYIKKYSPIDNIKQNVCYPNYYIQAGLNDPRVGYWEPAKFVATLRYNLDKNCNTIIILKTEMNKGHFGNNDRYKYLEEIAERYAFLVKN